MSADHLSSPAAHANRSAAGQAKPTLAVVGSGIAGLSAAYLLKQKYDVTLLESHERVGMGVFTIDYRANGIDNRIDIPLRVFCEGYYPNLLALYRHIGVDIEAGDHAGVFIDASGREILHYGNLEWTFAGRRRNFSYPKARSFFSVRAWRLILAFRRFNRLAQQALLADANIQQKTLGQFLQQHRFSDDFCRNVLLPVLAVTCTCDYQSILDYPADVILVYLTCGVWKFGIINAKKGVDDIVPRLTEGVNVRTRCRVNAVREGAGKRVELLTDNGETLHFDQVVIASQAQQASAMLADHWPQKQWLQQVPFERSYMMVHTDSSFLPQQGEGCSAVSYCLPAEQPLQADQTQLASQTQAADPAQQGSEAGERPQVSVDLTKAIRRYQHQATVFQTWHPTFEPDADKLLAKVEFSRPVVTLESRQAMQQLRQVQQQQDPNQGCLWFCGSYLADKVPLLDAAVDSSVAVAQRLGVSIPWHVSAN